MKIWTYKEARDKVQLDLDLTEEDFVTENEMIGYFNSAIDEAEAEIHTLAEDYFLTYTTVATVLGSSEYSLPSDVYAQKIRALIYANGTDVYPVSRFRAVEKFLDVTFTKNFYTQECYRYMIINKSITDGYKLALFPNSRETGSFLTLWYLRNATRIPLVGEAKDGGGTYSLAEVEASFIECPEFINFIFTWVKGFCRAKENGGSFTEEDTALITQQRKMMVDTLTQRVVDDDNTVVQDRSHYNEHT